METLTGEYASMDTVSGGFAGIDGSSLALEITKGCLTAALGELPGGGFLAEGFSILWDVLINPEAPDVWGELRDRVNALVDKKISDYDFDVCKAKIKGFSEAAHQYRGFALQKERDWPQIRIKATALEQSIVEALPEFQKEDYAVALTPLFVQMANLRLMMLRDLVRYGKKMGLENSSVNQYRSALDDAVDPGSDSSYVAWVKKQYQSGREKYPVDASDWRDAAKQTKALITYDREYWLHSMDYATYLWPTFHSEKPETGKLTERQVYLGPFGACQWEGPRWTWYNELMPPAKHPGFLSGLEVWSWDRLDAVNQGYGWPGDAPWWRGRCGTGGGSSDSRLAGYGAGGKWSFELDDFMEKVSVNGGTGVYQFSFVRSGGYRSHKCGLDRGGDYFNLDYRVTDYGLPNHQVADVCCAGRDGSNNMNAMAVSFRPIAEQIGNGFPNGVSAVVRREEVGFWFFRHDLTVKTDLWGTGVESSPSRLTDPGFWTGLAGTAFADGFDAVCLTPDTNWWFFKGQQTMATHDTGELYREAAGLTDDGRWPALKNTKLQDAVDAVLVDGTGNFWFFKDGYCAQTNPEGTELLKSGRITDEGFWPALKGTVCETGIDTVYYYATYYWFFRANQCLSTDYDGTEIVEKPAALTAQDRWPALLHCGVNIKQ